MLITRVPDNVEFQAWFRPGFYMRVDVDKDMHPYYHFGQRAHVVKQTNTFQLGVGTILRNDVSRNTLVVNIQPGGKFINPYGLAAGPCDMPYAVLLQLRILSAIQYHAPAFRPRSWKYLQDGISYRTSERVILSW